MRFAAAFIALWPFAAAADIVSASYADPTDIYGHGAVGGGEYAALEITLANGSVTRLSYPDAIFEDTAPRLADFDGDGAPEVLAVVSTFTGGARLQVFGVSDGKVTPLVASAPIGRRNRWHAVAGIADLDGNGLLEVAYVDRPHLAKILRIAEISNAGGEWTFTPKAALEGLTNHRIGEPHISGGIRECGSANEVITVNANWSRIMATGFDGEFSARDIGRYDGPSSLVAALECSN